jgi:hypothetical protein
MSPSKKNNQQFEIYIYLIRHKLDNFADIEYAEFFLGHMWDNRIFKEYENNGIIGIATSAYAPFLCTCEIKFRDGSSVFIERYIDFEMGKRVRAGIN